MSDKYTTASNLTQMSHTEGKKHAYHGTKRTAH
jgi:hypothetical protein